MKNLERNKKPKRINDNDNNNNFNDDNNKNKIYSKKGNYYEIASNKKFNINNNKINNNQNININEYKKDRNFFNCFNNKEKEDINFSDTESFLSLFKNSNNYDYKKGKKLKNNKRYTFYDNKNQNIMTFFPKNGKSNFHKDKQIIISIRKLIENEKYNQLFDFIEKDINLGSRIPNYISNISKEILDNSNEINYDKIKSCINNDKYEILYDNNNSNNDKNNLNNNSNIIIEDKDESEINMDDNNNKIIINDKYENMILKNYIYYLKPI